MSSRELRQEKLHFQKIINKNSKIIVQSKKKLQELNNILEDENRFIAQCQKYLLEKDNSKLRILIINKNITEYQNKHIPKTKRQIVKAENDIFLAQFALKGVPKLDGLVFPNIIEKKSVSEDYCELCSDNYGQPLYRKVGEMYACEDVYIPCPGCQEEYKDASDEEK